MKAIIKPAIISIFTMVLMACGTVTPYTPNPTNTLAPSTATSISSYTPTYIPDPTNTFSPIDNYVAKIIKIQKECRPILDLSKEPPLSERDWGVYDCRENKELFIIKADGSKAWQVEYKQLSSYELDRAPDEIRIIHWSRDNRYVYFVPSFCCWDPGIAFLGEPVDEIWQFDVITGTRTKIMSGFDYTSFSPNDEIVLLIPQMIIPPPAIHVYDLKRHEISRRIVLSDFPNNASAGMVVWAKNGNQFAVLTASDGGYRRYEEGEEWKEPLWSVLFIDLSTQSQKIIVSDSEKDIDLFEITDDGILLIAFNEYKADGTIIVNDAEYDLKVNGFISTSTPSP